ncbi:MAG: hypothetical protein ABL930_08005 [Pseudobdellovibrio sp.]
MKPFVSILACSLFAFNAYSAPSQSTKIHSSYTSFRALGMGNAFTAVADDYSLIMYNPAGFAKKKNNEIQISLVGAGVSSKTTTLASDIKTASDTVGTDSAKAQAISDVLEKYYGQSLGGKVQALEMFWVRNGWGVALLPLDMTIDMSINRQVGPAIDLNVKGDTTIAFGYGTEVGKNLDAGITAKYVHRISVEEIVPAFELATDSNVLSDKRFKEGTAIDFDIGFKWKPDWFNSSTVQTAPPVVETITPPTPPAEEVKPVEATKIDDKKPEDKTAEEERKPQAEGDATEVKVAEEQKPATPAEAQAEPAKTEEVKPVEAAVPAPTPAPVVEAAKPETKVVEEAKTEEVRVPESNERFPLAFGLVVHNVIGGEFSLSKIANKNATEVPTKMYRVIDIGSEYMLRDGEDFKVRLMLDFKDLLHPEISLNKSFHTGVEFDYSPNTWFKSQFRAGLNQMYYTAGASFLFGIFNIDAVTYGEEVGTQDTKLENRVFAAKLGFNF